MYPSNPPRVPREPGLRPIRAGLIVLVALATISLCACQRVRVGTHPLGAGAAVPAAAVGMTAAPSPRAPAESSAAITPDPSAVPGATRSAVAPRRAALVAPAYAATPPPTPLPAPTTPPTPSLPLASAPPSGLSIPSIGLDAPIVPVGWQGDGDDIRWEDPRSSVGWVDSSALPGERSNVVLAGHHNIRGEVFRDLVNASVGDEVLLVAGDATYRYTVHERFIVPEKNVSEAQQAQNALWIAPTIDERLTMITCWPYRDNTHRLIVIAMPAPEA